jgi:hypothetical protein
VGALLCIALERGDRLTAIERECLVQLKRREPWLEKANELLKARVGGVAKDLDLI